MTRMRLVVSLVGLLGVLAAVWLGVQPSAADESGVYVEPNGRWHVEGETFWFGAPGDVFLTGPALGFAGGEGATDYAIWRSGEVHFAGDLVGDVRQTVSVVEMGLPTDIPVVISFHHGSPSNVAYIRDGVVYNRDDEEVTGWFNPDTPGLPGVRLVDRPPVLVPTGLLRHSLADAMGHPLLDWRLRLDGYYSCASEGPGDILVPPHLVVEDGDQVTLCAGDRLVVEDSTLRRFRVHGPVAMRGESTLERMNLVHGVVVESGIARLFENTKVNAAVQVEPFAQLRLDQSNVAVGSHSDYPVGIIVKTTETVVLVDSLVGIWHYLEPDSLGTIEVPEGFGPADVTLIDSRTAPLDFPFVCLDMHESYCSDSS